MAKPTPKNILVPSAVLLAICLVISAALGFTNEITKGKIAEIDRQNNIAAMAQIFTEKNAQFEDKTVRFNDTDYAYSEVSLYGKLMGYVFNVSNTGYGGAVSAMTGINADGTVRSVIVTSVDSETPGLGQSAKGNETFLKQFQGKSKQISTEKNAEIDALTGATITTKAIINDVNTAMKLYNQVKGGQN